MVYRPPLFLLLLLLILLSRLIFPSLSFSYSIIQSSHGTVSPSPRGIVPVDRWDLTSSGPSILQTKRVAAALLKLCRQRDPNLATIAVFAISLARLFASVFSCHCRGFRSNIDIFLVLLRILRNVAIYYRGSQLHQRPQ